MSWFKWRFVECGQTFRVKIIKRRSSGPNFIRQVLTTDRCLSNSESNCSKLLSTFTRLCLKSVCNVASISSVVQKIFDDHSLIIFHLKYIPNRSERILRSRPGRSFFAKPHGRIRFDPLNFSKSPHSRDTLTDQICQIGIVNCLFNVFTEPFSLSSREPGNPKPTQGRAENLGFCPWAKVYNVLMSRKTRHDTSPPCAHISSEPHNDILMFTYQLFE
jgi:hypothetical protein